MRLPYAPYVGSNMDAGCASVNTPRNKIEKDGLRLLFTNFIKSKRRIRRLKLRLETEVSEITIYLVGNDFTRRLCVHRASVRLNHSMRYSLKALKDICRTKRLHNDNANSTSKRVSLKHIMNTSLRKARFSGFPRLFLALKRCVDELPFLNTPTESVG